MTTNVIKFDEAVENLTQVRGRVYGHPYDDFARANLIKQAVADCSHPQIRHALEMIGVKMARLVHSPAHIDSVVDIAGYARTIAMILDEEKERKKT